MEEMTFKVTLKVSYHSNRYKMQITFRAGTGRVIYPNPENLTQNLYFTTGVDSWLAKVARKVLMDGKMCTIEGSNKYLTFELNESGVEFMKCAKELSAVDYRIWKAAYESLEAVTPLEEVMQEVVAHTLGKILSKDLEDKNGSHNLRRENDLRTLQLHTTEVKGHIRL